MIAQLVLLWLGTVGLILILGGLYVSVPRHRRGQDSLVGLIMYGFATLFWSLFTMHSTGYIMVIGGGVTETVRSNSLMLLGLVSILLSALLLIDAAYRVISSNA